LRKSRQHPIGRYVSGDNPDIIQAAGWIPKGKL
jgi:hypothetical protein